jgi:hypothetical protein
MKAVLIGVFLAVLLTASAMATAFPTQPVWGLSGWYPCNINGNYGGSANVCYVSWDGVFRACDETNRDAAFTAGANGVTTTDIFIDHLDGIAETLDGFEVKDGSNVLCTHVGVGSSVETWNEFDCKVSFTGAKTLTFHPTAESPWSQCGTYGQVAVKGIRSTGYTVPEFGTVTALVALMGAIVGLVVLRKKY